MGKINLYLWPKSPVTILRLSKRYIRPFGVQASQFYFFSSMGTGLSSVRDPEIHHFTVYMQPYMYGCENTKMCSHSLGIFTFLFCKSSQPTYEKMNGEVYFGLYFKVLYTGTHLHMNNNLINFTVSGFPYYHFLIRKPSLIIAVHSKLWELVISSEVRHTYQQREKPPSSKTWQETY